MAPVINCVGKIDAGVEVARLRARVIRMWTVPMFSSPSSPGSIEMVLLDQTMGKIQATIRKPLINKFIGQVSERETYAFSNLNVVLNLGTYRATDHQFKLMFSFKTLVSPCVIASIPMYGISAIPFNKILESNEEFDYLIEETTNEGLLRDMDELAS